jgi:hypothetical protein
MGPACGGIASVAPGATEVDVSEPGVDVFSSAVDRKVVAVKMAAVGVSDMDTIAERQAKSKTAPAENTLIAKGRLFENASPRGSGAGRDDLFFIL